MASAYLDLCGLIVIFRSMLLSRKVLIPTFGLLTVWPTMSLEELRHPASSQLPPSRCALMSRRWCLVSLSARSCCKALYSTGVSRFTRPVVDPKAFNKVKLASQWAREAATFLMLVGVALRSVCFAWTARRAAPTWRRVCIYHAWGQRIRERIISSTKFQEKVAIVSFSMACRSTAAIPSLPALS